MHFLFNRFFSSNLIFQVNQFVFSIISTFARWMLFISWYIYFCWLTEVLMEGGDAPWPAHRWKNYLKQFKKFLPLSLYKHYWCQCVGGIIILFSLCIYPCKICPRLGESNWFASIQQPPSMRTMSAKTEFCSRNNVLLLRKIDWRDTFFQLWRERVTS